MSFLIPVVLFACARPAHLKQTLACLRENNVPMIYVFADGPKTPESEPRVREVREILHQVDWCEIHIVEREKNLGLGASILTGVGEILKIHDMILVFEDDLICVPGTYHYLCTALEHYKDIPNVMSVTGWTHPLVTPGNVTDQPYFDGRTDCLVWGTWKRAWQGMAQDSLSMIEECEQKGIDIYRYGADLVEMAQGEKVRNIWAVRFSYLHILNKGLCLRPPYTLVQHIGYDVYSANVQNIQEYKWHIELPETCPPMPSVWPPAVENPECSGLWQKECGTRPESGSKKESVLFIKRRLREWFNRIIGMGQITGGIVQARQQNEMENRQTRLLMGRMLANQICAHGTYENIHDAEFCVFSQYGDDGILQYLVGQTQPAVEKFIEFGVQNYIEANTRFLLVNNNWSGLILDGDAQAMSTLRADEIYWRHDLTAVGEFITCENVNPLFLGHGFAGEIGLLSIDIDGNDYWVWEAINTVSPVLVVVEYNSVFGAERAITIPYDPAFHRTEAHYSNLYWGASLKALCLLAEKKGYALVGCNSAGNNAYFVRKDKIGRIPTKTATEGYVESKFRESRDKYGNLTYLRGTQRLEAIKDMRVVDVEQGTTIQIKDLLR